MVNKPKRVDFEYEEVPESIKEILVSLYAKKMECEEYSNEQFYIQRAGRTNSIRCDECRESYTY